jgi:hypothetical protein
MPAPGPPAVDDLERDARVRAIVTLAPGDGAVGAVGVFVPNARACARDYAPRQSWRSSLVFSGGVAYDVTGEYLGYVPSSCPPLYGHYAALAARLDLRPLATRPP